MELDEDVVTIAEALKPLGYVSAHLGKWHMRGDPGNEGYVLHDGTTTNNEGNTLKANLKPGEPMPRGLPTDMTDPKLSALEKQSAELKAVRPMMAGIATTLFMALPLLFRNRESIPCSFTISFPYTSYHACPKQL